MGPFVESMYGHDVMNYSQLDVILTTRDIWSVA